MNLNIFNTNNLFEASTELFNQLGIKLNSNTAEPLPAREILKDNFKQNETFNAIVNTYFIGIIDDTIFKETGLFDSNYTYIEAIAQGEKNYNGLMLFALELDKQPTRTDISDLTRAFNRISQKMPVALIIKYSISNRSHISLSISERLTYLQDWRLGEKVGKITVLKDIDVAHPHRGHLSILKQLILPVSDNKAVRSFTELYYYWQAVFSISVLNKAFYEEIITWFNRAVKEIKIPGELAGSEKHKDFTVRLIARLIFIWFLKELRVVKDELLLPAFENGAINKLIKPKSKGTNYYKFILQNLFFNALNSDKKIRNANLFDIYAGDFTNADELKEMIFYSPYLNGGLFDIQPNDWCEVDDNSCHQINNTFIVPDDLFLNVENGLNGILSRYKFTIAENTPLEEEIAVDPEMLGRIFENLLAEQSDDTKEAARKNAGAFYTPRPVVSYMCRNTLLKHLGVEIKPENSKEIIHKLLQTTVLDPACGSGAFPMGMLEEMMQVLSAIDPEGKIWVSEMMRSKDESFRNHISEMFADGQIRYVKKLGLLRNSLFGIDLLEYAIEITKLRCWLSLIVEQRVDFDRPNFNLKPLPNLEFKFYKKNTLLRFYKGKNLNEFIAQIDNDNLLQELDNLENQYFITKSDSHGTKEQIKQRIIQLLEKAVDSKYDELSNQFQEAQNVVLMVANRGTPAEKNRAQKKVDLLAKELAEIAKFKITIKDFFIESVIFPGIFNKSKVNHGFDIVIGNPPYVNTKLISKMGLSENLKEEYGYCDDLYNHFTIRGLELLKSGGHLSYITSDTFLTLQTKKNMRMQFLGVPEPTNDDDLFSKLTPELPECQLVEVINTPKAFSAFVNTAIFTIKKEKAHANPELVYIDIRKPNANSFGISEEEWQHVKTSKENLSSWELILERTFSALGHTQPNWTHSHNCDGDLVKRDSNSTLLKFKLGFEPYRKAINFTIFSPTEYNCQILERIIKPARPVFDKWWFMIETSKEIERNRDVLNMYVKGLKSGDISIIGLLTDGGQGLATANNGKFVGYTTNTPLAERCQVTRVNKLWEAIEQEPKIKLKFDLLKTCYSYEDVRDLLGGLSETKIWDLFDGIKNEFGLRIFGKGYMYRIIPNTMIFDVKNISAEQKVNGIKGDKFFVPYDKGDKEGNRWYQETPYLIDWSEKSVSWLKSNSGAKGLGMPVVRNPQFYFRNGFCWSDVLDPSNNYIKCRLKGVTVNDVKSMSLYDESGYGDKYFICNINSRLFNKVLREFFNGTVAIQMNDIRKLPIKIPTEKELAAFNKMFDECLAIKQMYFAGEIDRAEMNTKLKPIDSQIDIMVNQLYGIDVSGEVEFEEFEDTELFDNEADEDELEENG